MSSRNKSQRAAALKNIKAARQQRVHGGGTTSLDEFDRHGDNIGGGTNNNNDADNDDIYETVTEEEYIQIVNARRQREDFVVDDDGLGYYDDGEELLGDEANHHHDRNDNNNKRSSSSSSSSNAALTKKALKKARFMSSSVSTSTTSTEGGKKNQSMWDFVNRGNSTATTTTTTASNSGATTGTTSNTSKHNHNTTGGGMRKALLAAPSVDALLEQLDDPLVVRRRRIATTSSSSFTSRNSRTLGNGRSGSSNRHSNRRDHRGNSVGSQPQHDRASNVATSSRRQSSALPVHDDNDDAIVGATTHGNEDDDHEDDGYPMATDHHTNDNDDHGGDGDDTTTLAWDNEPENHRDDTNGTRPRSMDDSSKPNQTMTSSLDEQRVTFHEENGDDDTANTMTTTTLPRRRRFVPARSKLGQMSKAAADAIQKQEEQAAALLLASTTTPTSAAAAAAVSHSSSSSFMDATSASFQPCQIANCEVSLPSLAGQLDLSTYLLALSKSQPKSVHNGDDTTAVVESSSYMDMYWMDLCERGNGDLLVFGKVWHETSFVSTCVLVTGNVRNLFVLPKSMDTDMMDVHGEIGRLLHDQHILPRAAGVSWKGKPVKRNYAFGDSSIPRTNTDYLKVVYDAKYPVPTEEICMGGNGKTYSKILGAGASLVENFIVKRKLMGPCWVRIQNPQPMNGSLSWCKLECRIDSPKNMTRLDIVLDDPKLLPAPPPFVTMSIKLKTVVNPKTHKSEIVSVSAVCHKNVLLESASDDTSKYLTQLSLIRPLAVEGSNGAAQFPRDIDDAMASGMPQLRRETNERALLSRLLAQIGQWDPDVIVGHNIWGYDMEVILSRCLELKVPSWSRVGRRRRTELPSKAYFSSRKDMAIAEAMSGRLLCDTYLSAQELLRETTYSLSNLSATQLKISRQEIEPVDIPQWFQTSKTIVHLAQSTLFDAQLVQKLMFKLQVLPLTKQLTCIAGNIWTHTLKGNRAERTEYLLLHEFHRLKYIPPEKKRYSGKKLDPNSSTRGKAKYSGGLVLEPKKGLYESFILLLDFNSLYPSLIQEYNLCFTTMDWSSFQTGTDDVTDEDVDVGSALPNLPDPSVDQGVLPRVIKSLVDRRRAVKGLMKNEAVPEKKQELDIRQLALKLTANSMYGCLGFSNSRFYAQPIAALVTAKGRETLQRSVDIAQNTVGLEVIYGDTDSIMINTRINDEKDLKKVKELGEKVKKEVNRLYRTLELEIDGIFRTMLLLKKKKYAARTVEELPDGTIKYGQELKGLDLVRRDWCIQSKDTGRFVTEQILSGDDSEEVLEKIHLHLEEVARKMRAEELPLEKYVITKGLSKHPNDYPDGNTLPHVYVAKMMLKDNRLVNTGDHIPYVITAPIEKEVDASSDEQQPHVKAASVTERARHPDDIARSNGLLKPDIEWYLTQQILPPISRLCEPIDGTSQQLLAEKLGLDSKRFNATSLSNNNYNNAMDGEIDLDYVPESLLSDDERFKDVKPLMINCIACGTKSVFPGVFATTNDDTPGNKSSQLVSGLRCTNPNCIRQVRWGHPDDLQCYSYIVNSISIWIRELSSKYYSGTIQCDEASCGLVTRQLSVCGGVCLQPGCSGRMYSINNEREVHRHHKYLESLFNIDHAYEQRQVIGDAKKDTILPPNDITTYKELHTVAKKKLNTNAYNFISPTFWNGIFPISASSSTVVKQ